MPGLDVALEFHELFLLRATRPLLWKGLTGADGLPLTAIVPLLSARNQDLIRPATRKPGARGLRVEERSRLDPPKGRTRIFRLQILGPERQILMDRDARYSRADRSNQ